MRETMFADILLILFTASIIIIILSLVNRGKKKLLSNDVDSAIDATKE